MSHFTDRLVGGPLAGLFLCLAPTTTVLIVPRTDRRFRNPSVNEVRYERTDQRRQGMAVWRVAT